MDKIILLTLLFTCLLHNSCTTDDVDYADFIVYLKNTSNQTLKIEAYSADSLLFENILELNQNSKQCEYNSLTFFGYRCSLDSMIFRFPNGKGYVSNNVSATISASQYEFSNKSPFTDAGYTNTEGNTYEFIVTEEDYNNAFDID